jgi:hypothetical protein
MMRNRKSSGATERPFGNLYRARRAMKASLRERFRDVRFFDPLGLQRAMPDAYEALVEIAARHGRRLAECIFYETFEGVTIAFLTRDPAELRAPPDADVQSWRVQ